MSKSKLFLLKPDFMDGDEGPFYCPHSLPVEGLLGFYPQLRDIVDVGYLDYPRPRPVMIAELGEDFQSLPALILAPDAPTDVAGVEIKETNGKRFIDDQEHIRAYLEITNGLGRPH
jgi:hypothetical protein